MFNIGFIEFVLMAVAALLLIRPDDWPKVIRHVTGMWRELQGAFGQVKKEMQNVAEETSTIIGLDGKEHVAYDVSALEELVESKPITDNAQVSDKKTSL